MLKYIFFQESNPEFTKYIPLFEDESILTDEFRKKLEMIEDKDDFHPITRETSQVKFASITEKKQNLHRFQSSKKMSQSPLNHSSSRAQLQANNN